MAGNITLALRSAQTGLAANQIALDTVTNNIVNANSATYSRKIAVFEQRSVNGVGAGVQIADIIRNVDEGLLKSLRGEYSKLNELSSQENYFVRMQELFGSPADNSSISHIMNQFASAMESLAVSPEKTLEQSEVIRWAQETTLKLQQMDKTVQELRLQADQEVGQQVNEINVIVTRIQDLNESIVYNQSYGRDVTDLQDQRDADINKLSEYIDIKYFTRADGDIVVYSGAGKVLVDSVPATMSHNSINKSSSLFSYEGGDFDGIYIGSRTNSSNDITNDLNSGSLKGLVDIRDTVLGSIQAQIDELSSQLKEVFNQIHNMGTAFPGISTLTGTRTFADSATQAITLDAASGNDDVAIAILTASGDQLATTTLETIMTSASYGTAAQAANGPWTIDEVAQTIEDWVKGNGAADAVIEVNADGNFSINLNTTTLGIGFRDQATSTLGSAHENAAIGFNSGGSAAVDETVNGFSYFLGLNDFFVHGLNDNVYDSNTLVSSFNASAATLTFEDSTGAMTGSPLTITGGDSLWDIRDNINTNVTGVTASVISDGSDYRLRILHKQAETLVITQAPGDTLLSDIGFHKSPVGLAGAMNIRGDILSQPAYLARGSLQWDSTLGAAGEFHVSSGDGSNAEKIAVMFSQTTEFRNAGGISSRSSTFSSYSAAILSSSASDASTNELRISYQQNLTDSLQNKSDNARGVNLDEEMSNMILYEQAYVAATRVISVIQNMLDALERIV